MSYAVSAALQAAVFGVLQADAGITVPVLDALPAGEVPETYVQLGAEEVRARSDRSARGAEHRLTISVITSAAGYAAAKGQAAAVGDAMDSAALTLTRGRVVGLWFDRARARRTGQSGRLRRIDLRYRVRVEDI